MSSQQLIDGLHVRLRALQQHYVATLTIGPDDAWATRRTNRSLVAAMNPIRSPRHRVPRTHRARPVPEVSVPAPAVSAPSALLAAIGSYGVTAYVATRRRRKSASGWRWRAACRYRPYDSAAGIRLTAIGCAIGLLLAAGASQVLVVFLFGVAPLDPVVFGIAATCFAVIGLAACYLPAHRATTFDPLVALRHD
jgi:hypothetical protein